MRTCSRTLLTVKILVLAFSNPIFKSPSNPKSPQGSVEIQAKRGLPWKDLFCTGYSGGSFSDRWKVEARYIRVNRRLLPAGRADSVKVDLVILRDESGWGRTLFVESTSGYFKKPVTGPALEMMMMFLPGPFVKNAPFRCMYLLQPSFLDQDLKIAIDGCLIQRSDGPATDLQNFIDSKRPVNFPEDFLDGIPLTCFSLHPGILIRISNGASFCLQRGNIPIPPPLRRPLRGESPGKARIEALS